MVEKGIYIANRNLKTQQYFCDICVLRGKFLNHLIIRYDRGEYKELIYSLQKP